MSIKNRNCFVGKRFPFSLVLAVILVSGWCLPLDAQKNGSLLLVGPSFSKHYASHYDGFKEFHPGFGAEFQVSRKHLVLGFQGYYMAQDSLNNNAYWSGFTAGYRFGKINKFWCEPFLIAGGIKKREYNAGKFGFFALPFFSAGYKWIGFNIGYIPRLSGVTEPILVVQLKIRLLSFHFKLF